MLQLGKTPQGPKGGKLPRYRSTCTRLLWDEEFEKAYKGEQGTAPKAAPLDYCTVRAGRDANKVAKPRERHGMEMCRRIQRGMSRVTG